MSALKSLNREEMQTYLQNLFADRQWSPPTYVYLDHLLTEIQVVNQCTVLDDDDALDLFPNIGYGAVFVQRKTPDSKGYLLLPWKYDPETNELEPFGS